MASHSRHISAAQYSLLSLIVLITVCGGLTGIIVNGGLRVLMLGAFAALGLAWVSILWGAFYCLAPEATKVFTVLGTIACLIAMLLPIALFQSRESARRLQIMDNLRKEYFEPPTTSGARHPDDPRAVEGHWTQLYSANR